MCDPSHHLTRQLCASTLPWGAYRLRPGRRGVDSQNAGCGGGQHQLGLQGRIAARWAGRHAGGSGEAWAARELPADVHRQVATTRLVRAQPTLHPSALSPTHLVRLHLGVAQADASPEAKHGVPGVDVAQAVALPELSDDGSKVAACALHSGGGGYKGVGKAGSEHSLRAWQLCSRCFNHTPTPHCQAVAHV